MFTTKSLMNSIKDLCSLIMKIEKEKQLGINGILFRFSIMILNYIIYLKKLIITFSFFRMTIGIWLIWIGSSTLDSSSKELNLYSSCLYLFPIFHFPLVDDVLVDKEFSTSIGLFLILFDRYPEVILQNCSNSCWCPLNVLGFHLLPW